MNILEDMNTNKKVSSPKKAAEDWCKQVGLTGCNVTSQGIINSPEEVLIHSRHLEALPFKFGTVRRFDVLDNELSSFDNFPEKIVLSTSGISIVISYNRYTSLKDIHKHIKQVDGGLFARNNPIKSHILGIFFIKGLTAITLDNEQVMNIVNKHLKGVRDVHACQEELIKAGFAEYAKI